MEWPFAESATMNGSNGASKNGSASYENIANYLSQKKICLMINLPLRQHRYTPAITKGYITRRMAVEYSVPLVTDIKCAKLLVKVCHWVVLRFVVQVVIIMHHQYDSVFVLQGHYLQPHSLPLAHRYLVVIMF